MYFRLNAKCIQVQETTPQRIYSLKALQTSNNQLLSELGIAFLYNPDKKMFGIYQTALLQGKQAPINTLVAHCMVNEEVEFELSSNQPMRRVMGLLRFKNGTERRFAIGISLANATTMKLSAVPAEQRVENGPKATVYAGVKGKFVIPSKKASKKEQTA
jgi:hypothetical protein